MDKVLNFMEELMDKEEERGYKVGGAAFKYNDDEFLIEYTLTANCPPKVKSSLFYFTVSCYEEAFIRTEILGGEGNEAIMQNNLTYFVKNGDNYYIMTRGFYQYYSKIKSIKLSKKITYNN